MALLMIIHLSGSAHQLGNACQVEVSSKIQTATEKSAGWWWYCASTCFQLTSGWEHLQLAIQPWLTDQNGWDPLTNRAILGWSSQTSRTHQTGATDQLVLCFEELDASAQLPPRDLSCALWICTDLSKGPGATGLQFHESQCFLSDRDHRCPRPTGEWNKRNPVNEWWQMDLNDHGTLWWTNMAIENGHRNSGFSH